ncbi:hypothetical protein H5410_015139 [Solanum commersonii]|uniref:Uncharacterized protein n=1 Tax=Solanum commersonii TaxID=4109 RepID=A0A9J5ZT86_SOLCO|nr:hypothetical protein H5410_015139 [Solanum commersonii]
MIFNSSYQTVDLEIEVMEEEYREWYIPRALRSFFCYSATALGVPVLTFLDLPSLKLTFFEREERPLTIPIDLLESPIGVHQVGIEPTNSPILSWAL